MIRNVAINLRHDVFKGEGHCARREDPEQLRRVMAFLWDGWQNGTPTSMPKGQLRLQKVLEPGSAWETTADFPEAVPVKTPFGGVYSFTDTAILLAGGQEPPRIVADGLGHITGIAISTDGWRLYVADLMRRFIFAYAIQPDGTLGAQYKLAPFHLPHDCHQIGATGLCVSAKDRVFAATELGVQGIVSFGITDLILPLPGDVPARRVALKDGWLYAASDTAIYRRRVQEFPPTPGHFTAPTTPGYGDDVNNARPHLPSWGSVHWENGEPSFQNRLPMSSLCPQGLRPVPELAPGALRLDYLRSGDAAQDYAVLVPPADTATQTWVVVIHGHGSHGDQLFVREDIRTHWLPDFLRHGFGILSPNLRDNAWLSPLAVADLDALLDYCRAEYGARQFIFYGGSMGGTSALCYAALRPANVAALAVLGGVCDLPDYVGFCRAHADP